MAYALVGSLGTVATGTSSVSPTFAQATSSGHLLVAWVYTSIGAATTSTQSWSNASPNNTRQVQIWYKANCGASETSPVFSSSGATMFAALAEFSGGATLSPADQNGVNIAAASSPQTATFGAADAASGELVLGGSRCSHSKAETATSSHTYNNGATATGNLNNDATSTSEHYRFSYGITTGNASADTVQAADGTMNLLSLFVSGASFKLAPTSTPSLIYADQRVTRNSLLRR